jgi:hypothetical protein
MSTNLGGGIQGLSTKQTLTNYRSSEQVMTRRIVTKAWNTSYATGVYNQRARRIGPFRAVTNSGDFLSRANYSCGGPNPIQKTRYNLGANLGAVPKNCDGSDVPPSSCNPKFVPDSSEYLKYRKQRAVNVNYNDISMGGDDHSGSFVAKMFHF